MIISSSVALFKKLLNAYNNSAVLFEIIRAENDVSINQINLFKALVIEVVNTTGHSYREIEDIFIKRFSIPEYHKNIYGKIEKKYKKVEEMKTNEFKDFYTQCLNFSIEFLNIK